MQRDVAVIGGGPAGLSGALMLGRCRRSVVLFDDGHYRNAVAHLSHGFLSRDGVSPEVIRREGRKQLVKYGVELKKLRVLEVARLTRGFRLGLSDGTTEEFRKVLLATGLRDELPAIEGIEPMYGKSVFHCPYCDGYEVADQKIAVVGADHHAIKHALGMLTWSLDVVLLTNGARISPKEHARLETTGVQVNEHPIRRVEGRSGMLKKVVFVDGQVLPRQAMFFASSPKQRSGIAAQFELPLTKHGTLLVDHCQRTIVPGLFAAGDTTPDLQFMVVAAAEGTRAAVNINQELQKDDVRLRRATGYPLALK